MAKKQWQTGDIVEAEDLNRLETATQPATTTSDGLMSKNDKTKLDSIESGAQKNPDTVSTTKNGLMSATDKSKLDGIESGAQVNPNKANQAEAEAGTDDSKYMTAIRVKQAILKNAPGIATTSSDGLLSKTDKTKLNGIESGAQVNPNKATQAEAESGTDNTKMMTPLSVKQSVVKNVPTLAMTVVNHGATASTARPEGAVAVYWIGTVEPTNATDNDLWIGGL